MNTKYCPHCKQDLPVTNFNKDSHKKSGLESHCRECKKQYKYNNREMLLIAQKKRRKLQTEELKLKVKTWNAVYYARRTNKVKRLDICEMCGSRENIQGHHRDYNKPLEVKWVCQSCHTLLDNQRRSSIYAQR